MLHTASTLNGVGLSTYTRQRTLKTVVFVTFFSLVGHLLSAALPVHADVHDLLSEYRRVCPVLTAACAEADDDDDEFFNPGTMLLNIPFVRKFKKKPLLGTLDYLLAFYVNVTYLAFMLWGGYKMALYAVHALHGEKTDAHVHGPLLSPDDAQEVWRDQTYFTPDVQLLWKVSKSPQWQASVALMGAAFCGYWFFKQFRPYVRELKENRQRWKQLVQVAYCFRLMQALCDEMKREPVLHATQEYHAIKGFFEHALRADVELAYLWSLPRMCLVNPYVGSSLYYGWLVRMYGLLDAKREVLCCLQKQYEGLASLCLD